MKTSTILGLLLLAKVAWGQEPVCPVAIPEDEVWEIAYSVVTDESAPWDACTRLTWWSGWIIAEEGVYDVPYYPEVVFIIWHMRPLVSCYWFGFEPDCMRPESDPDAWWVWPQFYTVCPDWEAFPGDVRWSPHELKSGLRAVLRVRSRRVRDRVCPRV